MVPKGLWLTLRLAEAELICSMLKYAMKQRHRRQNSAKRVGRHDDRSQPRDVRTAG